MDYNISYFFIIIIKIGLICNIKQLFLIVIEKEKMSLEKEGNDMFDLEGVEVGIDIYDLNNKLLEYEYDLKKKVGDLINDIKADQEINEPDLLIIFKNKVLDNNKTLMECGVISLSKLYLKKKEDIVDGVPLIDSKITLKIREGDSNEFTIKVNPEGLCQQIIDEFLKVKAIDNSKILTMSCNGINLKSDKTISSYNIKEKDIVFVHGKLRGGFINH